MTMMAMHRRIWSFYLLRDKATFLGSQLWTNNIRNLLVLYWRYPMSGTRMVLEAVMAVLTGKEWAEGSIRTRTTARGGCLSKHEMNNWKMNSRQEKHRLFMVLTVLNVFDNLN